MSLRDELARFVIRHSKLDIEHVEDTQALGPELGCDSHALIELVLDIEDAYEIVIPPEELSRLSGIRFGKFVEWIGDTRAATPGSGPGPGRARS